MRKILGTCTPALVATVVVSLGFGAVLGVFGSRSLAEATPPTEHKGLKVVSLGVISGDSMKAQLGLEGYKMQLRAITIAPGGQIAKHSHATRPGVVKVISGAMIEGRPDGEREYTGADNKGVLEDKDTVM